MKAADLRKSILQAAVQGKLVPQDIHDEPASELLKRIKAEKTQLIKDGKLKKEKPLPAITEDEIPYDLPDGWVWCRLGEICVKLTDGSHNPPPNTGHGFPVISAKNIKNGHIVFENVDRFTDEIGFAKENPRTDIQNGDIILGIIGGSIGNLAIYHHNTKVIAQRSVAVINTLIQNLFTACFLRSPLLQNFLGLNTSGTAQGGIYLGQLKNILFPLPPIAQQTCIVAKVEELMHLCDELEAAEKELDKLENHFIEYLPKSILQAAVQGKLVPQNVYDEPASQLLWRIKKEKAQLIKEGKLKKEKPLPAIADDEIPYDLPDGWVWCRLGEICNLVRGITFPGAVKAKEPRQGLIRCATTGSVQTEYNQAADAFVPMQYVKNDSQWLQKNDIMLSSANSKELVGKSCIWESEREMTFGGFLTVVRFSQVLFTKYAFHAMQYLHKNGVFSSAATQTTNIANLNNEMLSMTMFPLPPLAEQVRIVAKVDELMTLCAELKSARETPVKPDVGKVIAFPQRKQEPLAMVARGSTQEKPSKQLESAIDDLFGDDFS